MGTTQVPAPEVEEWRQENHDFAPGSRRKILTKQEVEERGLAAVEELLDQGNVVQIVPEGRPGYVVVPEWLVAHWLDELREAMVDRVQAALADVAAGRVEQYDSVEALMAAIDRVDPDDE